MSDRGVRIGRRRYRPYPGYKPRGGDWLGDVPSAWDVKPLGYLVRFRGGATPDKSRPDFWDGAIPWVSPKDMKRLHLSDAEDHVSEEALRNSALSMVPVDAVLVVVRGMILARSFPVALTGAPLTINQDMKALIASSALQPRFLAWSMIGATRVLVALTDESAHGTRKLETPTLAKLPIPVPSVTEQCAIADFLDRETATIDTLVDKKRALIERLTEKRTALISRTVTRGLPPAATHAAGLDPHPKLKPSCIDWLGDVPEHWKVKPLGFLVRFRGGATPDKSRAEYWDGEIPWASPKDMKRMRLSDVEDRISEEALKNSALSIIPVDAVLIVVRGMILAHSFPVALTEVPLTINQDMKALIVMPALNPPFLAWSMIGMARALVALADESAHGTRKIETSTLAKLPIPVPSLVEQGAIADFLDRETAKIDTMVAKVEEAIERLQEYRTALITAAVTGKIDVREAA